MLSTIPQLYTTELTLLPHNTSPNNSLSTLPPVNTVPTRSPPFAARSFSNPANPTAEVVSKDLLAAALTLGKRILVLSASTPHELDRELAILVQQRADALIVAPDAFFDSQRDQILAQVGHHAIPTIYERRETVMAGGLMSYGPQIRDAYRQAGVYTARILNGAKPADLPVVQTTKIELVVNLKTAKKLGLPISRDFLARVDEVIQ